MALDPKQATATLKRYLAWTDSARFSYVTTISQQISADLHRGRNPISSFQKMDTIETPHLAQWLENDVHLVALQILLDKKNYNRGNTDVGRKVSSDRDATELGHPFFKLTYDSQF